MSVGLTYEWMHRFALGRVLTVRVWTKASPATARIAGVTYQADKARLEERLAQHHELKQAIRKSWDTNEGAERILLDLSTIEFVSAVEVLDEDGNGPIVYVDWP